MSSREPSGRDGSSEEGGEQRQGLGGRPRRAFGCITWLCTAILVFLGAAFLLLLPFRYVGDGELYRALGALSLLVMILLVPGTVLAAALGFRTYRTLSRPATRAGMGVGALIGWMSFATLVWLQSVVQPLPSDAPESFEPDLLGYWASQGAELYIFPLLALLAAGLVLHALFATNANSNRRLRIGSAGAVISLAASILVLAVASDLLGIAGALVSAVAAALAGWVGGAGYARTGGDEMIPPDAVKK